MGSWKLLIDFKGRVVAVRIGATRDLRQRRASALSVKLIEIHSLLCTPRSAHRGAEMNSWQSKPERPRTIVNLGVLSSLFSRVDVVTSFAAFEGI